MTFFIFNKLIPRSPRFKSDYCPTISDPNPGAVLLILETIRFVFVNIRPFSNLGVEAKSYYSMSKLSRKQILAVTFLRPARWEHFSTRQQGDSPELRYHRCCLQNHHYVTHGTFYFTWGENININGFNDGWKL